MHRWRALAWLMVAILPPLAVYGLIVARGYDGKHYLRGDCPYYYVTALSLYFDHDLDLSNQLRGGIAIHSGNVALAADGTVVPKHPLPLPIAAMPFIILAGGPHGALAFNLAQLAALLVLLWVLARRVASPPVAALTVAATGLASQLPHYAWNFSPDLFGALLLIGAVTLLFRPGRDVAIRGHFAAGLLLGISVAARYTHMAFLPGAVLAARRSWRHLLALGLGVALPLLAVTALHLHLFGSPFTSPYDRMAYEADGELVVRTQRSDVSPPQADQLWAILLGRERGLFWYNPITLAGLAGLPWLWRRHRGLAAWILSGTGLLIIFLAGYPPWVTSDWGNRFLMPVVALAAVPLAAALQEIARSRGHAPESAEAARAPLAD